MKYYLDFNEFEVKGIGLLTSRPNDFPFVEELAFNKEKREFLLHLSNDKSMHWIFSNELGKGWSKIEEEVDGEFKLKHKSYHMKESIFIYSFLEKDNRFYLGRYCEENSDQMSFCHIFSNDYIPFELDVHDKSKIPFNKCTTIEIRKLTINNSILKSKVVKEDVKKKKVLFEDETCYQSDSPSFFWWKILGYEIVNCKKE